MKENFFIDNVIAIIPPSGEIIGVERKGEQFHSEIFKRIDKEIIPNYLDDFILIPEAYTGHDYATISAANGNAIFIPMSLDGFSDMLVSIPDTVTIKQKESIEGLLKELNKSVVYLLVCKIKNPLLVKSSKNDIRTYIYDSSTMDTLDDLINIEEHKKGGKK